jgi:hypothetical protein
LLMVSKTQHPEFCEIHVTKKAPMVAGENLPIKPKNRKKTYTAEQAKKSNAKPKEITRRVVWTYDLEAYKRTL